MNASSISATPRFGFMTTRQFSEALGALAMRVPSAVYRTTDFRHQDKQTRWMVMAREGLSMAVTFFGSLGLQRPYELIRDAAEQAEKNGSAFGKFFTRYKQVARPMITAFVPILLGEYLSRKLTHFDLRSFAQKPLAPQVMPQTDSVRQGFSSAWNRLAEPVPEPAFRNPFQAVHLPKSLAFDPPALFPALDSPHG